MKRVLYLRKKFCCTFLVAMLMTTSTGSAFAATGQTAGQTSVKNAGVNITWYDLGTKYKDYYMGDDYDTDFYQLNMSNDTENKTCFVNGKGEEVLPPGVYNIATSISGNDAIIIAQKDGIAYIISKNKMQTMDMSAFSEIKEFDNQYMTVRLKSNNRVAITDWDGKLLLEDKSGVYQNLRSVCDGVFSGEMPNNNYQLLDSQGNLLTETVYSDIWGVSENLIRVQSLETKCGFVDVTGKEIIPMVYEDLMQFQEGLVGAKKDGKWGVIDKENQVIIPFAYESVTPCYDGVFAVGDSGKYGLLDKTGTSLLPIEYTEYPVYEDGVFRMIKDNQTILFHTADESIETTDYSYYQREENGLIHVEKIENGKTVCAYLDENENMLTGFKEYSLYNYDNGMFIGVKPGEYPQGATPPNDYMKKNALLDKDGNNLTGFKYRNVRNNSVGEPIKGYQVFFKDYYGAATLVNQYGAEVLPPVFDDIILTKDGYAFVTIKDAGTGTNLRVGYFKIPDSYAEKKGSRPITVYLNGTELYFETELFIKEQKTVVPMRKIFESLGAAVQWDSATKTVTAVSGEKTVKLTIGNEYAQVNGENVKLDLNPFIENGSTFVPLRFVSENLGAQVEWENALRRVNISSKE